MRGTLGVAWVPAAVLAVSTVGAQEPHPRLFVTPERVKTIREQAAVKDSHHQQALAALRARVEKPDMAAAYGRADGYVLGYKAVEAAFLSALADNDADRKKYAEISYETLGKWGQAGSATLGQSMNARCTGLAYDWAYGGWSDEQRKAVRRRVDATLAALGKVSHSNLGGDRTSNFVGVIRGAELLLWLCSGGDVKAERARFLIGELRQYFDNAFGDLGACQEGPGYTEYPAPFAFAAALAAREAGEATLTDAIAKHAFWKLVFYTRTAGTKSNQSLQWGVGGGADYTEGWSSQLLHLCPADHLSFYLWWYDRSVGRLTPATMDRRFDSDRHGTVWSLLYYPAGVTPRDPAGVFPPAVADSRGYLFFRNHWAGTGTILASLTAQVRKDQKGWNQPEQLALNLHANGCRFIGGPAKATKPEAYSSLLVDGKYTYAGATEALGRVVAFEPSKAGGYAIVQGGQMYEKLGVKEAVRHMRVDFRPGNRAVIGVLDRIKTAAGEHAYTWQAKPGTADDGSPLKRESGLEAGLPFFLMKGAGDTFLKGWVVHPGTAGITAAAPAGAPAKGADADEGEAIGPLRITVKAADADIWVVMVTGTGTPPQAAVTGEGLGRTLTAGDARVRFDAAANRMVCE